VQLTLFFDRYLTESCNEDVRDRCKVLLSCVCDFASFRSTSSQLNVNPQRVIALSGTGFLWRRRRAPYFRLAGIDPVSVSRRRR
jgi:hypothetical protein